MCVWVGGGPYWGPRKQQRGVGEGSKAQAETRGQDKPGQQLVVMLGRAASSAPEDTPAPSGTRASLLDGSQRLALLGSSSWLPCVGGGPVTRPPHGGERSPPGWW